jgi:hypothetical protein
VPEAGCHRGSACAGGKTAGIAPAATTNPSSMAPMNVFIVRTPAAFSVDAR